MPVFLVTSSFSTQTNLQNPHWHLNLRCYNLSLTLLLRKMMLNIPYQQLLLNALELYHEQFQLYTPYVQKMNWTFGQFENIFSISFYTKKLCDIYLEGSETDINIDAYMKCYLRSLQGSNINLKVISSEFVYCSQCNTTRPWTSCSKVSRTW